MFNRDSNPQRKLSDEEVIAILQRIDNGEMGKHLADEYKVSCSLVSQYNTGKLAPHLYQKVRGHVPLPK